MLSSLTNGVQAAPQTQTNDNGYDKLVQLFDDWRAFEQPPLRKGAPDYTATHFAAAHKELSDYQARLNAIDTSRWPVDKKVDWQLVRAEMNGFNFNHRVLQPWVRDPAFYQTVWMEQSDVPAHEGPTNHAVLEVWTYSFPLSNADEQKMAQELAVVPPLLEQARDNLTGNARDLWIAGINNFHQQSKDLQWLGDKVGISVSDTFMTHLEAAKNATLSFTQWLEQQATGKTGPSGIGKDNYTWYQQNVHYVPLTWEQEVGLLQRELDRAWANLKLEEQRNRQLPPMKAANTAEAFATLADQGATRLMQFLKEEEIMPIKSNMEPALREHLGSFVPEEQRNFFAIGMHYDPLPLYSHFYHWFDLAQMRDEPHQSPIRRGALLYNIWDSRNEGIATGVEEMFMHAGLYDDSPRSREIVWIMLAQRAARGLGSLYAHANEMSMEEASQVHVKWTPRNWMQREPELLKFEQHLYLRQPGYGTSYVVGKYLIERLLTRRAEQLESQGKTFVMKKFLEEFNDIGCIPVSMVQWEMTGYENQLQN
ncbi:MAG: hypothetical protein ACR2PS_12710 [Pseudomonadales bacterium]